jgi:hypothetical protein
MRREDEEEEAGSSLLTSMAALDHQGSDLPEGSSSNKKLAHEIGQHLALLKTPLPVVNGEGLMVSSTQMQGWLWSQKGYRGWKKRWFVWRYSDLHEQWNLYAYKSPDHMVRTTLPTTILSSPSQGGRHSVPPARLCVCVCVCVVRVVRVVCGV